MVRFVTALTFGFAIAGSVALLGAGPAAPMLPPAAGNAPRRNPVRRDAGLAVRRHDGRALGESQEPAARADLRRVAGQAGLHRDHGLRESSCRKVSATPTSTRCRAIQSITSTSSFEPHGHHGFPVPHYDIHAYYVSPAIQATICPNGIPDPAMKPMNTQR